MKKHRHLFPVALTAVVLFGLAYSSVMLSHPSVQVSAGATKSYVVSESSVVDGHINSGDLQVSGDVSAKNNTLIFGPEKSTSKVLGKTKIQNHKAAGLADLFHGSMTVQLNSLVDKGTFSICFGMPSISSDISGKGALEVRLEKKVSTVFLSVIEHYGEDIEMSFLTDQEMTSLKNGEATSFAFDATTEGEFTLTVGGSVLLNKTQLNEGAEGYFGLISQGENQIQVSAMSLYGYTYNVPTNVDYVEQFDHNGTYNGNFLVTQAKTGALSPSYLAVDKDSETLRFSNTGEASLTTRFNYSNFELSFDVPFLSRVAKQDENGNFTQLISNWFAIAWGLNDFEATPGATESLCPWILFEGLPVDTSVAHWDHSVHYTNPRLILYQKTTPLKIWPMDNIDGTNFNVWNPSLGDAGFSIKLTMVDGTIDLYGKFDSSTDYFHLFTYDLGESTIGYLRLFTWSDGGVSDAGMKYTSLANFSIDNFSVKNKDNESIRSVLPDLSFTPNGIEGAKDYDYQTVTDDSDLISNLEGKVPAKQNQNGALGWIIGGSVAGLVVLGGLVTLVITLRRKKQ